ncbi:phosphotransferase [Bradyrhizobium vignae]|uniref:phosphotransferase n=1 Tax=Bradyrhizobium vignae TaxID=1549949 RepID=UPI0013E8F4ED|nr:phosphotransferase [Bradyrhizobium vignae]
MRTPRELIVMYWDRVWNNGELELVREICGDPITRHDASTVIKLSHDEQIERIRYRRTQSEPYFTHEVVLADDTFVCSVWNAHTRKGTPIQRCGIEVFQAENGRLTHCWNSPYISGRWGREGDPAVPANLKAPEILDSLEQISPEWLQRLFAHSGTEVPLVTIARNEQIGQGTVCSTAKVNIAYNIPSPAPQTVFAKFHPASPHLGAKAVRFGYFPREVAAYNLLSSDPPVQIPRVYLAQTNKEGTKLNLVLEDLSHRCRLGNQLDGCNTAEAAAVVEQLARLHRRFLNSKELNQITWGVEQCFDKSHLETSYSSGATICHDRFANQLGKAEFSIIDEFGPLVGSWWDRKSDFRTLLHGDPRVDNILFEMGAGGNPSAYLVDWQLARIGDPQIDVAYFLTGSLSAQDRRTCERDLVKRHAALVREIEPCYTDEIAMHSYRLNTVAGLLYTVGAANKLPENPSIAALLLALVKRNCTAVEDWGSLNGLRSR